MNERNTSVAVAAGLASRSCSFNPLLRRKLSVQPKLRIRAVSAEEAVTGRKSRIAFESRTSTDEAAAPFDRR
jgi:hypothetical protein